VHVRVGRGFLVGLAVVVLAACSGSSGDDAAEEPTPTSEAPEVTEATATPEAGPGLESLCGLVSTDEVAEITGVPVELREEPLSAGPPYGRCSWEPPDDTVVAASVTARSLAAEGVGSPDEWWTRNLAALEDAVASVEAAPDFGEHGYVATDDDHVEVLWFPSPETYVEARVYGRGSPPPSPAEVERMARELAERFGQRLEPHLPLPSPEDG
jgi:hypothetical protein